MTRTQAEREAFLDANAERMRHAPTEAERVLWEHLRPLGFFTQQSITGHTKNGLTWK